VRRIFRLIALGINALVTVFSKVVTEQELVVPGAFGTVGATASGGNQLRVAQTTGHDFEP
jgi:hypothetical protein